MNTKIDRSKCGAEYSLCPRCKFEEDESDYERCGRCIILVDAGYSDFICGIPVGSVITHLHRNFEPKLKGSVENG